MMLELLVMMPAAMSGLVVLGGLAEPAVLVALVALVVQPLLAALAVPVVLMAAAAAAELLAVLAARGMELVEVVVPHLRDLPWNSDPLCLLGLWRPCCC